ncbi:hypothetical protein Lal_00032309, partial [Lupinus albus]
MYRIRILSADEEHLSRVFSFFKAIVICLLISIVFRVDLPYVVLIRLRDIDLPYMILIRLRGIDFPYVVLIRLCGIDLPDVVLIRLCGIDLPYV